MPLRILIPYVAAIPAVEAARSLVAAEQIAVGTGRMPKGDHSATLARWRRAVVSGPAARPKTPTDLAGMAAAAGIGFRKVH